MVQEFDRPEKRIELAREKAADGLVYEPCEDDKYRRHGNKPEPAGKNENRKTEARGEINGLPLPVVFQKCKILIGQTEYICHQYNGGDTQQNILGYFFLPAMCSF